MEKQKFLSREWYEAKYTQWQNEIEKWHESGEPITEWCREMGISKKTFYRWRVKLGDVKPAKLSKNVFEPVKCQNTAKFAEISSLIPGITQKAEIMVRNGNWEIEIHSEISAEMICQIIGTVAQYV